MTNGFELVVYEPLKEIVTYDNEKYYFPKKKFGELQKMMDSKKFIPIGDSMIATASIKTVRDATQEDTGIEYELKKQTLDMQVKVRREIRKYKADFPDKEVTIGVLQNMINKYNDIIN